MLLKYWKYLKLTILIIVPLAILIFPLEIFINSPAICDPNDPNYNSCGIWQAIYSFLHLDFEGVRLYNSRGFIMGSLIAGLWGWELFDEIRVFKKRT